MCKYVVTPFLAFAIVVTGPTTARAEPITLGSVLLGWLIGSTVSAGFEAVTGRSSPWDFVVSNGKIQMLAPWLATPPQTPSDRWFGGYHERENQASLLAKSYAALRILPQNIRVFKGDLPPSLGGKKDANPFHGEGLYDPAYEQDRTFFLGRSP